MFVNNKPNKNIFKIIFQNLDMTNAISESIEEYTHMKTIPWIFWARFVWKNI